MRFWARKSPATTSPSRASISPPARPSTCRQPSACWSPRIPTIFWQRRNAGCARRMSHGRTSTGRASEKPLPRRRSTSRPLISRISRPSSAPDARLRRSVRGGGGTPARCRIYYGVASLRSEGMADPVSQFATRIAYGARQLPRVAWYIGHGMVMRRLSQAVRARAGQRPRPQARVRGPDRRRLYADMAVLFQRDLANVEAGIYPLPADHDGTLPAVLKRSRLFFEDLPDVHRRRERRDVRQVLTEDTRGKRPNYYLQNFHFQSGGWLTPESAQRYDIQVEVLFNGSANATRRQAPVPPHEGVARCR